MVFNQHQALVFNHDRTLPLTHSQSCCTLTLANQLKPPHVAFEKVLAIHKKTFFFTWIKLHDSQGGVFPPPTLEGLKIVQFVSLCVTLVWKQTRLSRTHVHASVWEQAAFSLLDYIKKKKGKCWARRGESANIVKEEIHRPGMFRHLLPTLTQGHSNKTEWSSNIYCWSWSGQVGTHTQNIFSQSLSTRKHICGLSIRKKKLCSNNLEAGPSCPTQGYIHASSEMDWFISL